MAGPRKVHRTFDSDSGLTAGIHSITLDLRNVSVQPLHPYEAPC